mmetsp:Transcript_9376/g.22503  ORF Transcript_9376/g.22503 Transcript_9376/m.22503 type:complete len:211 (+) Transcript_9376:393-1025(+)
MASRPREEGGQDRMQNRGCSRPPCSARALSMPQRTRWNRWNRWNWPRSSAWRRNPASSREGGCLLVRVPQASGRSAPMACRHQPAAPFLFAHGECRRRGPVWPSAPSRGDFLPARLLRPGPQALQQALARSDPQGAAERGPLWESMAVQTPLLVPPAKPVGRSAVEWRGAAQAAAVVASSQLSASQPRRQPGAPPCCGHTGTQDCGSCLC